MNNKVDVRQLIASDILSQLFPYVNRQQLDFLLRSIDSDLTSPLRVDANQTANLVVNVSASRITNAESLRNRSASFVNNTIVNFTSGTVTFPSTSGGNIVASTGATYVLTLPVGQYVYVLLSIDQTSSLQISVGTPNTVLSNATVPSPITNTLPFAYLYVHNTGGTIDNITQSAITQLVGGGGGSSGTVAGTANEVNVPAGNTSLTVTFGTAQASTAYVVIPAFRNLVDTNPEFQPITVTNKTVNGFTATWNDPLDSSNYYLGYIIPSVQSQIGEVSLSSGSTSVTVTMPIPQPSTNYVVVTDLVNLVDSNPEFQPITITNKTTTQFTATWNMPLDTANYRMAYNVAVYQ